MEKTFSWGYNLRFALHFSCVLLLYSFCWQTFLWPQHTTMACFSRICVCVCVSVVDCVFLCACVWVLHVMCIWQKNFVKSLRAVLKCKNNQLRRLRLSDSLRRKNCMWEQLKVLTMFSQETWTTWSTFIGIKNYMYVYFKYIIIPESQRNILFNIEFNNFLISFRFHLTLYAWNMKILLIVE